MALLVAGLQSSFGFALLGPIPGGGADAWETAALGYRYGTTIFVDVPGGPAFLGDVGTPKNIAEEYRRNVPVMYYTYDQTFLNYFGPDGAAAVDGAFAIMNGLPSADQTDLTQFPLESMFYNYTAQADYLTDLKSVTLHMLVEQLGLADPARFVWTLHDRVPFGPVCPLDIGFIVVQRNFDYLVSSVNQIQYSSYINDVLYSYFILQGCTGTPIAITVPFSVDPEASIYTTVSANNYDGEGLFYLNNNGTQPLTTSGGLQVGAFYTGLTRDDMAGLHYLFTTNNVNLELPEPTSLLFSVITNTSLQQLFPNGPGTNIVGTNVTGAFYTYNGVYGYGNYGWLIATSQTNSPAVLLAQYPGLVIASSSNYFVLSSNITYTQYFAPLGYGTPYPSPLQLVTVTNYTPVLLEKYVTTFANVFPNRVTSNSVTYLQTTVVAPKPGTPYPAPPFTNVTTQAIIATNVPSGDFFLLPLFHTNVCPLDFLYTGLTNVVAITNFLTGAGTNVVTPTNTSSYSSTLSQINYFTNFIWVTHPVACAEVANAAN